MNSIKGKLIFSAPLVATAFVSGFLVGKRHLSGHSDAPTMSNEQPQAASAKYTCSMHPQIIRDGPGSCPICGMPLQKIEDFAGSDEATAATDTGAGVAGRADFSLSPNRQQMIGVTTDEVGERPLESEIRASGKVAFDPELYSAIEEYRQAASALTQVKDSPYLSLSTQSKDILESSRVRLRLMGLTDAQISQLAKTSADPINLILPKGNAWVYAEVYEYEAAGLKVGQTINVTSPSISGASFAGKILSISPVLNAQTRTFRVRALVPDPKGQLRPDMFVNAKIKIDRGTILAVPVDAILHSGEQNFVFVVKGQGNFSPRLIEIGPKAGDFFEVKSGLQKGERVVTSANFLIDSESRLRSALKSIGSQATHQPDHAGEHAP